MKRLFGALCLFCLLFLSLFLTNQSLAATTLTISPLRQEIGLSPGDSVVKQLVVTNTTKKPEVIKVFAQSFGVVDPSYNYDFGKPPDYSSWIQFSNNSATILPAQVHTFNYNIAVPINAEPGGHYIAVFASTTTPASTASGQTNLVSQAGSLIYLTVNGQVSQIGKLVSYHIPRLTFSNTISWNALIENTGNNHFTTKITQAAGYGFKTPNLSGEQDHLILPQTIRAVNGQFKLGALVGLYKTTVSFGLGDSPAAVRTVYTLYLSPSSILFFAIVIALIASWLVPWLKKRHHKVGNKPDETK